MLYTAQQQPASAHIAKADKFLRDPQSVFENRL
jgi:hypothetical protein